MILASNPEKNLIDLNALLDEPQDHGAYLLGHLHGVIAAQAAGADLDDLRDYSARRWGEFLAEHTHKRKGVK